MHAVAREHGYLMAITCLQAGEEEEEEELEDGLKVPRGRVVEHDPPGLDTRWPRICACCAWTVGE